MVAAFLAPSETIFSPILMQLWLLAVCRGAFIALGQFVAEARLARFAAAALPARHSGTVQYVHDMAVMKIDGRM